MIYMFLSNNPLSGDINSSNLPCFLVTYRYAAMYKESKLNPTQETKAKVNIPVQAAQQSDENNSSSGSDTESQLSSLGPWGDDPEIQEKVR